MGENKKTDAIESTLPAQVVSPGADSTQAAAAPEEPVPATKIGHGATLEADAPSSTVASQPPMQVDAGHATTLPGPSSPRDVGDYDQLLAIDPNHYVVGKEIARGGMGRIMAARDRRLGRPVAIKELLIKSEDLHARFEREARITAKLQHPTIVNVLEAGAWPRGEPFYVMKLVSGQSLDKVIADQPKLETRLGLLPNVIAAVDALAYAHNMHVIHRDLKPANILVGEFGETVVIDWGLAKDLADSGGASEIEVGPFRTNEPGKTVVGAIMGTPGYMPVEQANGDSVDERADVYALGAMLYHVLVGAPPYVGKTADEILAKVISGPPPPINERVPEVVPPDLVTIVDKAMARNTVDRYPTAKELADDLKRFQTGQLVGAHRYSTWQLVSRWVQRHRAAVSVGAIAVLVLAVMGVLALQRVVRARHLAEDQRDRAQSALSLANAQAGDVLLGQRDAAGALAYFRRSLAAEVDLVAKNPMNAFWQRDLLAAHERVGRALAAQGSWTEALAQYRSSLAVAKTLAANDPTNASLDHNDEWQRHVALFHNDIGDALMGQADEAGALEAYRAGLAIARQHPGTSSNAADDWEPLATELANKVATCCRVEPTQ